jgi:hypothetical protein
VIEVDEAYVGGVEAGFDGRQNATKAIVAIAVEIKQPKGFGRIRLQRVDGVSKDSLIPFIESAVEPGATVHTDGWQAYRTVPDHGYEHERTIMRLQNDPAHVLMPGVHRVASLLKAGCLAPTRARSDRSTSTPTSTSSRSASTDAAPGVAACLLPTARASHPHRPHHIPKPDRQPTTRPQAATAAESLPAVAGDQAAVANPNLTQIDTPLHAIAITCPPSTTSPQLIPAAEQLHSIARQPVRNGTRAPRWRRSSSAATSRAVAGMRQVDFFSRCGENRGVGRSLCGSDSS